MKNKQLDAKNKKQNKNETFLAEISDHKEHNRNAGSLNNTQKRKKKDCKELKKFLKAEIHLDSLKGTLKKIQKWKIPSLDGINRFWFENLPDHPRQFLFEN